MKIDLIYLWVDGDDPEWRSRREPYMPVTEQQDRQTFCDGRVADNDELKYSLRSVEMYATWVNHIYIVTDKQTPNWLNTKNPKVTIIDHTEILPPEVLPMYNSRAIELAIHRIKGLSEHYIFANDDMTFGRKVSPNFFFTTKGKAKSRFRERTPAPHDIVVKNSYGNAVHQAIVAISRDFGIECENLIPSHQIDPYVKSQVTECIEQYKAWHNTTLNHRFRTGEDMQRHIFSLYAIAVGAGVKIIVRPLSRFKRVMSRVLATLRLTRGVDSRVVTINKRFIYLQIKMFRPALLCFNDTEYVKEHHRQAMKRTLQRLYPRKSQFEK